MQMESSTKDNGKIVFMKATVNFLPSEVCTKEHFIQVKSTEKVNKYIQMMMYMRAIMLATNTMELEGTFGKME
mgnify:CR=1 FL=1